MASENFSRDGFGARVRLLREARGWTQKDLAANVGGWDSKISSWESGTPPRDPADLVRLAEVLECSIDYLLTGREPLGLPYLIDSLRELLDDAERVQRGTFADGPTLSRIEPGTGAKQLAELAHNERTPEPIAKAPAAKREESTAAAKPRRRPST